MLKNNLKLQLFKNIKLHFLNYLTNLLDNVYFLNIEKNHTGTDLQSTVELVKFGIKRRVFRLSLILKF